MNVFIVKILVAIDYDALILKYRKLAIDIQGGNKICKLT